MAVKDNEKIGFNHDGITDPSHYSRRGGLLNGWLFARGAGAGSDRGSTTEPPKFPACNF